MKKKSPEFISRDLSWLDFNARVLDEANSPANLLLDRLNFLAITAGNLDEFFMVRIASLRQLQRAGGDLPDPAGNRPGEELILARSKIERLLRRQYRCLQGKLLPELAEQGIFLRHFSELDVSQQIYMQRYFSEKILPVLTPLAVDQAHPFPVLNSGAVELAVSLRPRGKKQKQLHAFVEVPPLLERFIPVPADQMEFLLLEELISTRLEELFPQCEILDVLCFRLTRDMDFSVEDDADDDLLRTIGRKLLQRRMRDPVRLELQCAEPHGKLEKWLTEELKLEQLYCYHIRGPLHLKQFSCLIDAVQRPELQEEPWPPVMPAAFVAHRSAFEAIREQGPLLLALPFHSFTPVLRLLEEAAEDPDVLAIKQTLYRVSGNSPVVRALQRAAENGKQVTVVLELKARFDESNNIAWARALDESGAHVVYGIAGLKVHCKMLLIVRRENGEIRRYVHLATGNYNDRTACCYTDAGLLSCDPEAGSDAAALFNVLTGFSGAPAGWKQFAVAPFTLRSKLEELVEREISHTAAGHRGKIVLQMNSLSDEKMVHLLHTAADAGVELDLIVRGICCYRPLPKQDHVRIISIVDRYLEHARIFYFRNNGDEELYLSSADWMSRNLDRRIEILFPVRDFRLKETLKQLLAFLLADTDKARKLLPSGAYTRCKAETHTDARSQAKRCRFFRDQAKEELQGGQGRTLKVFTARKTFS